LEGRCLDGDREGPERGRTKKRPVMGGTRGTGGEYSTRRVITCIGLVLKERGGRNGLQKNGGHDRPGRV